MDLTQLGGAGLLVLILLREIFGFLKNKGVRNGYEEHQDKISQIYEWQKDLYRMHNVYDDDGVPKWYVKKSVESALESIAECLSMQTELLKKIEGRINGNK